MANPLSNLEERLRKAAAGEADSLECFGIKDGFKYSCPNTWSAATSSKEDLEEALKDAIIFAEAANRLHLDTAEKIARSAIQHMTHSYFCLFDKMPREVNAVYYGKELAQELLNNIKEVKKANEILKRVDQLPLLKVAASTSTAAATPPTKSPSKKRKISTSSSSTEGSKYTPSGTDAGSSEKWSGEDGRTSKKTSSPKKMPSPKKTSTPPKMATPAASATPAPSSSATAASSATARPSAGKPGSAAASSVSKRSHHKNTPCPFQDCEFCGTDLRRHLYVHVKKGELAENSISHIITIARAGDRQFGSEIARKGKKPLWGKQRKWCPVLLCDAIVIDVGRHLVNKSTHGISKDSREFQRLLCLAKPYTGLAEMEGNLAAPASPIVELRPDSSASCSLSATHPDTYEGDSSTHYPAPSVSALSAHPSARDEVSASQPPAASVTASNAADSEPGRPTSATPWTAVPRSPAQSHQGSPPPASSAADTQSAKLTSATPSAAVPVSLAQSHQGSPPPAPSASEQPEEASEGCAEDTAEDFAAVQGSATQYFTCAHPKTNRHRWLVGFYQYLTRPTAGDKKQAIRLQHAVQMRKLLEAIDPGGDDIMCLLANEGDEVWSGWVKPHLKAGTKKPGTLISYLTSYEKFLSFVTHERFNKTAPPIHPNHLPTFHHPKGSQRLAVRCGLAVLPGEESAHGR